MKPIPPSLLTAGLAVLLAIGCSDPGATNPNQSGAAVAPQSTDQAVLRFPSLPIVDESEATLKAQGIYEVKEIIAVLSESIGIELPGGSFKPFVKAGTTIPVQYVQVFSTVAAGQKECDLSIFRGRAERTSENHAIGTITIGAIPYMAAGAPRIELTMNIERNGDVLLSARELTSERPLTLRRN